MIDLRNDPIFLCEPLLDEDFTLNLTYSFTASHFFIGNNTVDPDYDSIFFSELIDN